MSRLTLESLEDRLALSVYTATLSGGVLSLYANYLPSNVRVVQDGSALVVIDSTNAYVLGVSSSAVQRLRFVGGSSNDSVVNDVSWLPMHAWGNGGDDYLEGFDGADFLVGGPGNDILVGYGGGDQLWGQAGRDHLNGGGGMDYFNGGTEFDTYRDDFALDGWVQDGHSRYDVIQGESGTCSFASAMAEAAEHVDLNGDVVRSGYWYRVRLVDNGNWNYRWVYFDGWWNDNDIRPGQTRAADGTPTGVNTGEFWTLLYQRAYLQLCGTNTSDEDSDNWTSSVYNYRDPARALYAISGWSTSQRTIGTGESTATAQAMRNDVLAGRMMIACDPDHAYAVQDVYQDAGGNWMVRLYNPWGYDATHEAMAFVGGAQSNDGDIIISWATFRANFTRVHTAS